MNSVNTRLKESTSRTEKRALIMFLLVLVMAFFSANALCPMIEDDLSYGRLGTSLTSWGQLWDVLQLRWNSENIRLGNILCIIFTFCDEGRGVIFNICNTVVFISMLLALVKYVFDDLTPRYLGITAITLFLFCPAFVETYLWEDGSLNYMWGACFLSTFLVCYKKTFEPQRGRKSYMLCGITAVALAAWIHEALAFPLFFALVATAILNKRERNKAILYLSPVAVMVILFLLAPGMSGRAGGGMEGMAWLKETVFRSGMAWLRVFLLPLFILCLCAWVRRRDLSLDKAGIITWLLVGSVGLYLFSASKWTWGEEGPAYYPKFIMMVATLMLMRPWILRNSRKLAWLAIPGVAVFFGYQLSFVHGIHLLHEHAERELASSNVVGITYNSKDKQLPWMLRKSLPAEIRGFTYKHYNAYHNKSSAAVVIYRNVIERGRYMSMGVFDDSKIRHMRVGEYVVLQLPRDWMCADMEFSSYCRAVNTKTDHKIYFYKKEVPEWIDYVHAYSLRRFPISSWARDYVNGRHHVMFEIASSGDYNELYLPITHETTFETRLIRLSLVPGVTTDIDDTDNQIQMSDQQGKLHLSK